ncbi:uncharacterized protein M421DRAFT_419636 [Didymella exigua CBS 183.55]|uniref:Impact N-terminal domain-containing protein n=1 Tax=Didymella exigua CBS 183.55 TaxID=1150837 RepID=A0A6A5RQD1_9PLEO|nr:uncharacterized protein M421DRAFT_419636 [Didymella exigua CBS 183.55]KAF1929869.1 hypothetical protein M421DRAFT_419636 [Didymella exigua CBS 183.55]
MAQKRAHPDSIPDTFHSSKITEQTSSFKAVFSPTLSATALQRLPEFLSATHRISAYRVRSRQKTLTSSTHLFDTAHDDDGESWAGGRLARVLHDTQAEGAVVVARWYGGTNIGPVRFTCIEKCAKEAIWKWKVATNAAGEEERSKKQRAGEEARRSELVQELERRDRSITALRGLLADKKATLSGDVVAPLHLLKPVEYGKMGLDVLRRLDKARDATIGAILTEMDKVDKELERVLSRQ